VSAFGVKSAKISLIEAFSAPRRQKRKKPSSKTSKTKRGKPMKPVQEITVLGFINYCLKADYDSLKQYLWCTQEISENEEDFLDKIENMLNLIAEAKLDGTFFFIDESKINN